MDLDAVVEDPSEGEIEAAKDRIEALLVEVQTLRAAYDEAKRDGISLPPALVEFFEPTRP
jgi:hypothetical protein